MNPAKAIQLIECPRDAMQGWKHFIPTKEKIKYLDQLLKVGFDTIDFGSFVSHKTIPQMRDTTEVITSIQTEGSNSRLLAIVANVRGAEEAARHSKISFLGFPFSISPTFQQRNTNSTIAESLDTVIKTTEICAQSGKELVVYISMAFGNPYGDEYNEAMVCKWIKEIAATGINTISLADTVGLASPEQVSSLVTKVGRQFPALTCGVHLHSTGEQWKEKTAAALSQGCRRFDGALNGIGGCPMANDVLVGNMDMAKMIPYFREAGFTDTINDVELAKAIHIANEIFE